MCKNRFFLNSQKHINPYNTLIATKQAIYVLSAGACAAWIKLKAITFVRKNKHTGTLLQQIMDGLFCMLQGIAMKMLFKNRIVSIKSVHRGK